MTCTRRPPRRWIRENTELFHQTQQLVVTDVADIGLISRNNVSALANLTGYQPTPWAPEVWDIHNWRTAG